MIRKSDARASSARAVVGHRLALLSPIVTALGTNVSSIEISLVYSQTWGTNRQYHEVSSRAVKRSGVNEGALWTLHIRGNVTRLEPTAAHHSSRFVIKDSLSIRGIQTPNSPDARYAAVSRATKSSRTTEGRETRPGFGVVHSPSNSCLASYSVRICRQRPHGESPRCLASCWVSDSSKELAWFPLIRPQRDRI
jgi:hypothetical protein